MVDFSKFDEWKDALPKEGTLPSEAVHFSSLQVYGDAYCLCLEVCRLCANLDRTYKYSLGEQLRLTSFNLVMEIQNAGGAKTRVDTVPPLQVGMEPRSLSRYIQ